ncbi:MAG TPA: flagellar biosynthetic protein FliR, partial [Aminivibrio sp.]|nr:flagellar biosynthetic protein FliR [Aminivibrio sp.]
LIGIAIGFLAALPLYVLQISGELIGISMGLSMVSLLDPLSEAQASIIGQLQFLVGLWFYFRWNGHLLMTQSVVESLRLVPPGKLALAISWDLGAGEWLQQAFVLSLRFVLPFYGAILLADVGLGFLARTVPQMNIFVLGLPLKIALGFFVLMVVLPVTVEIMAEQMERYVEFALRGATAWR